MSDWQPIETAPKDGTLFRARGLDHGTGPKSHFLTAVWEEEGWAGPGFYDANCVLRCRYLTGWKPLASAGEARRAETGTGSVHEHAVAKPDAPSLSSRSQVTDHER